MRSHTADATSTSSSKIPAFSPDMVARLSVILEDHVARYDEDDLDMTHARGPGGARVTSWSLQDQTAVADP
jgi:hypothetical protein